MTSKKTGYLLGAIAGAGIMAAAVAGAGVRLPSAHAEAPASLIQASTAPIFAPPPGAPLSFADIFDQVSPAVVSINVTSPSDPKQALRIPGLEGLPFDIVPRQPDGGDDEDGAAPSGKGAALPPQLSSGSGFFISPEGYIVTNNHVVENAQSIKIVLKDERELDAVIVGRDEGTDLAVLKVKGSNFPYVNFENSAKPRVGDWVIAVGNPFGLGGTATAGIISAYGRNLQDKSSTFVDYIQIDASINRGNSGGPTFDIYGRVIGVNTAIFSPSGGSVGIGFAIPADVADTVTKQLISGGKITRGYIGAEITTFGPEMAEAQGLGDQRGAIIQGVVPGGPSAKGGLLPGDVVIAVNGAPVKSSSELTREVAKARAGDTLKLAVLRDGKRRVVEVKSGVRPSERELAANDRGAGDDSGAGAGSPPVQRPAVLGMSLAPLDDAARRKFSIPAGIRGVVVEAVDPASDAGQRGLKRGDVIASVGTADRVPVSAADFAAVIESAKKAGRQNVMVAVHRSGRTQFLPLKIAGE